MDSSIQIKAIKMGSSIIHFKGSQIEIFKKNLLFIFLEIDQCKPDEMQRIGHLIWVFTVCQSNRLGLSSPQIFNK